MVTLYLVSGKLYEHLALKLTSWGKKIYIMIFMQSWIWYIKIHWILIFFLISFCEHNMSFFFLHSEMHRTQSEFDDNLTFKVFIFQFINFYSSIFYIAFFKGRFVGYPGHYNYIIFNLRNEDVSRLYVYLLRTYC